VKFGDKTATAQQIEVDENNDGGRVPIVSITGGKLPKCLCPKALSKKSFFSRRPTSDDRNDEQLCVARRRTKNR
jgi:hypothetical protein